MGEIRIEELQNKIDIEDSNLLIIEDVEDTKKTTMKELKKAFNGDIKSPSDYHYYTSKRVDALMKNISIMLSSTASDYELKLLKKQVESLVLSQVTEGKDAELVTARGDSETLNARLEKDNEIINKTFMKRYLKTAFGNPVNVNGHVGEIDLYIEDTEERSANLKIYSKNLYNFSGIDKPSVVYDTAKKQIVFTQILDLEDFVVPLSFTGTSGTYYFYSSFIYGDTFNDKGPIKMRFVYSDDTTEDLTFNPTDEYFKFSSSKGIQSMSLVFDSTKYMRDSVLTIRNIMISQEELAEYVNYHSEIKVVTTSKHIALIDSDYMYSCENGNNIVINYYDDHITTESICNDIQNLKNIIDNKIDKCGLIENYGTYQFFNKISASSTDQSKISYDSDVYKRNNNKTLKLKINENSTDTPYFIHPMQEVVTVEQISLLFYIDRTVYEKFTDSSGIRVTICSDASEFDMANRYVYLIKKSEMIQGWNCIKRSLAEFTVHGSPDYSNIKNIKIEVVKTDDMNGCEIYFNSIIFNQRMKPTILIGLEGIYENGLTYEYPLLYSKGIPATIFSNNRTTLSTALMDKIVKLRVDYDWDLGTYGCHPNKDILTLDDNYRDQYLSLKGSKTWLEDNMCFNPVSYSAPYGNLRPITVPLLKNLGYKMTKVVSNTYCSFFSEKDFAIPTIIISNTTTSSEIIKKIDYAINNGQTLCLYTNTVTEYGDETNANKTMFEAVIDYIYERKQQGKVQCLSFKQFYDKCTK